MPVDSRIREVVADTLGTIWPAPPSPRPSDEAIDRFTERLTAALADLPDK